MNDRATPTDLRVEYARAPSGIARDRPRLSWRPGAEQTAYRVRVAADADALHDGAPAWDSGRVASDAATNVRYDGADLAPGARYHWTVRVWDADGEPSAWSDPATFLTARADGDWSASWIRGPTDGAFEPPAFTDLRTEFALDGEVVHATAAVAACHQCAVWLNGESVGRGQSFCYPDRQYYKLYDVTDALRRGENAVGVRGAWTGAGKGRPRAEPGFLVQIDVTYADGSTATVGTDGEWRVRDAPWDQDPPQRSPAACEPVEIVDGRAADGWTKSGFDGDGWTAPDVVGEHPAGPWERLVPQQRAVERSPLEPESVERLDSGSYVADFGRVYAAEPVVAFPDGEAGRRVRLRAGFHRDADGHVSETSGTQWTDMHYEYVQREGAQTFRPLGFLAFRYLEVADHGGTLGPDDVGAVARRNGVPDERAAAFECSDDAVESVWELARHSALYGSQEQFLDTPTREKGQFVSDSFDISMATMDAFGERKLTQQALAEFCHSRDRYWREEGRVNAVYPTGEGKRDIPDYTELFVEWVWRYYRTSGDRALLADAYPTMTAVAEYVAENVDPETGLVTELAGGDRGHYQHGIVDWPDEMRYGYDVDAAALTTVNVLAVAVFERVADATAALDRGAATAERWRDRAADLRSAIDDRLRRPDGVYVDGLHADGRQSDHASQHASAFALSFGLVPEADVPTVADHVVDCGTAMGPMTAYWLLDALGEAGRDEALLDLLTDADRDGWANIVARGGTFTWESWHVRDYDEDDTLTVEGESVPKAQVHSESHAWGATALVAIQERLLGVRVVAPGAAHLRVEPPAAGLADASGTVPTERGPVDVAWERDGDAFALSVTVPVGATASVAVPAGDPTEALLTVDGETVWGGGVAGADIPAGVTDVNSHDARVVCDVTAGTYEFALDYGHD